MDQNKVAFENYEWFSSELPNLVKDHENQYVVIKNKSVLAFYQSFDDALFMTLKTEEPGSFIIQLVSQDKSKTVQSFCSRMRVPVA